MAVQADELQRARTPQAVDRLARLRHREPELRIGLAGGDRVVCVARDAGRHPDQYLLGGTDLIRQSLEPLQIVERVEYHMAHPGGERLAQLLLGLGVSVEVDPRRIETA